MKHLKSVLAFLVLSGVSVASAALAPLPKYELGKLPKEISGTLYTWERGKDEDPNAKELYKFKRTYTASGDAVDVDRMFTYPDGKNAVKETVQYKGNQLSKYSIEYFQTGERGSATIQGNKILFSYTNPKGETKTDDEELDEDDATLVGENIPDFAAMNWDTLMNEKSVSFRLVVPERTETIGWKLKKDKETTYKGQSVVVVKMSASSPIIQILAKPLYFYFTKDLVNGSHKLVKYEGRVKPKEKDGDSFKDLDALTVFQ